MNSQDIRDAISALEDKYNTANKKEKVEIDKTLNLLDKMHADQCAKEYYM